MKKVIIVLGALAVVAAVGVFAWIKAAYTLVDGGTGRGNKRPWRSDRKSTNHLKVLSERTLNDPEQEPRASFICEDCAHYLGVSRTALSLAISRLVKRGEIVHPGHSRFVICGIV